MNTMNSGIKISSDQRLSLLNSTVEMYSIKCMAPVKIVPKIWFFFAIQYCLLIATGIV